MLSKTSPNYLHYKIHKRRLLSWIHFIAIILNALKTFARKFSNIDFFLKILPLIDDELVMSEM